MERLDTPCVPVSWGELLDKISILEIKRVRIACPHARANVEKEHQMLRAIVQPALEQQPVAALFHSLCRVNETLWDIEDAIREKEARGRFDSGFVELARSIYRQNDSRAAIKRDINLLLESALCEEKSYASLA